MALDAGLPSLEAPATGIVSAPVWWAAQIMQESAGNPRARRYERHLDGPSPKDRDVPDQDDGMLEDDASYGLCQVLGTNIREYLPGLTTFAPALLPFLNLSLGLRALLSWLGTTSNDPLRALARYNMGYRGSEMLSSAHGLRLRNQRYVDDVLRWVPRVLDDRR